MESEIILGRDSIPAVEIKEYGAATDPRPTIVTAREIDYELNRDGELEFFFSRADFRTEIADPAADLLPLLRKIRDNDIQFSWDDTLQKEPTGTYSSRLSLRNHEWCYIVIRLADRRNWQFCKDQPPFTVGVEAFKADIYREARRFESNGAISRIYQDPPLSGNFVPKRMGSRVAYFVADNRASGTFAHGFNIHVDLLYAESGLRLPVVIDPDIRWPGGSGP